MKSEHQNSRIRSKEKLQFIIFGLLVMGFFTVFFVQMHPMVFFDSDDWGNMYWIHSFLPTWGTWNPAKVFPETVMSLISQIAAVLIYPISGDYVNAQIWGHGVFVSLIITIYVLSFVKLIREKYEVSEDVSIIYAILFVALHFLIFRKQYSGNLHLFYSANVTCYYNYLLPALMNAIAVMTIMRLEHNRNKWEQLSAVAKGVFFVLIYLCIFSNLYSSVVLMAYVGAKLLVTLCKDVQEKEFAIVPYIKRNKEYLIIFLLWITQQIFEMNGGRADSLPSNNFFVNVWKTICYLFEKLMHGTNYWFVGVVAVIMVLSIVFVVKKRKEQEVKTIAEEMGYAFLALVLAMIYLFLLCARVSAGAICRPDVLIGPAFLGFLLLFISLIALTRRYPQINSVVPMLLCVLYCEINTAGVTFADINMGNLPAETCIEIDNDIIEQVETASERGATSMLLYIPEFDSEDNWPIANYVGTRISELLSKHGVVSKYIVIEVVPTKEKNEQFHINY